jgi:large subunit ribosomal protein L6
LKKKKIDFFLEKAKDTKLSRALYGLSRTLVANMVQGVSGGFHKKLQITGVGYRAQLDGKDLVLNMGYSHPVKMITPPTLSVNIENTTSITVSGIEKDAVGEFAAKIRSVRPPEPYKGKGIAYEGEVIRRKAGKTGK